MTTRYPQRGASKEAPSISDNVKQYRKAIFASHVGDVVNLDDIDCAIQAVDRTDSPGFPLTARQRVYQESLCAAPAIDEQIDAHRLCGVVRSVLDDLTPRARKVVELRFGLTGLPSMTLDDVAQEFGVTRERIRQVEAKALRHLRSTGRTREFLPYRYLVWGL